MKIEKINISKDKFWFIGPNAENLSLFKEFIIDAFEDHCYWRKNFHSKELPLIKESERTSEDFQQVTSLFRDNLNELTNRLKTSVPQFSSRYLGHMLPDPTFPATLGSFLGMLINNNNTSEESSPTTLTLEFEALKMICGMFDFGPQAWGHLTSGGTGANLHCLWRARDLAFYPYVLALAALNGNSAVKEALTDINLPKRGGILAMIENNSLRLLTVDERIELLSQVLDQGTKYPFLLPVLREFSVYQLGFSEFFQLARTVLADRFPKNFRLVVNKAAHYSIFKATNLLGFGKQHIAPVALDVNGAMDMRDLESTINDIHDANESVLAVVNIFGSTELGNIDNISEILSLRERLRKSDKGDFWLHSDAAWGGYFATLARDGMQKKTITSRGLENYLHNFLHELFPDSKEELKNNWDENIAEWTKHFLDAALVINQSDSITIDPHKSGYIPYPAGACLFKNYLVREVITYKSNYVNAKKATPEQEQEIIWDCPILAQYTIDGSRPSSAAVSVWLAHKTIPLDNTGHGLLIAKMVLASMYLQEVLSREVIKDAQGDTVQYIFKNDIPLTGIVCYTLKINYQGRIISLKEVNQIMDAIYHDTTLDKNANIYEKRFFLAFTRLASENYADEANLFLQKHSIPGQLVNFNDSDQEFDPWEDDDHLALFRNVTINPFFLIHKVLGKDNQVLHLAKDYAHYLAQKILTALDAVTHDKGSMSHHHYQLPCKVLILENGKVLGKLIKEHIQKTYGIKEEDVFLCRDAITAWNVVLRHRIETAILGVDLGVEKEKEGIDFLGKLSQIPFFRGAVIFTFYKQSEIADEVKEVQEKRDDWNIYYLQHFDLEAQNINYTFRRLVSLLWKVSYNQSHQKLTQDQISKNIIAPTNKFFELLKRKFEQSVKSASDDDKHPLTVVVNNFDEKDYKSNHLFMDKLFIFKSLFRVYLQQDEVAFAAAYADFSERFYLTKPEQDFIEKMFGFWKEAGLPWYLYEKRAR